MKVMCINNNRLEYNVNHKKGKNWFTDEMVERANEATIKSRNYYGSYRAKLLSGSIIESESLPTGGITIKIKNKWGKITSKEVLTIEKLNDAFGKAWDKVMGRKI